MRIPHKKFLIVLAAIFLLFYGLWQARDFLRGPRINLETPAQGEVFNNNILIIKGQAFDVTKFTLNGRTIFTDDKGNFKEEILLAKGVNEIQIYAEDKFGHKKTLSRTVLLK